MKYQALYDDMMRYIHEHGITKREFCAMCGRSDAMIASISHDFLGVETLESLNRILGTNHTYDLKRSPRKKINTCPPDWIKNAPREIQHLVAQEYLIKPERAEEYAKCTTAEEIYTLRQQRWRDKGLPEHSSIYTDNSSLSMFPED